MTMKSGITVQDEQIVAYSSQDCAPFLEDSATRRSLGVTGTKEFRHAAQFPLGIIEAYLNSKGIDMAEFMQNPVHVKSMLSDPDLSGFRIWEGRV